MHDIGMDKSFLQCVVRVVLQSQRDAACEALNAEGG
jgi:hypothetical protein